MLSMTMMSGICVVLSPLFGNLMDRVSLRKLMVLGGFLLASGYVAISLTTEFWQVLAVYGLLFAPANVLIGVVAVTVLLSRWFAERRGQAMGIAIAGIVAGGFLFSMIIQGLLDTFDWREAMRWLGLVLVLWTVPFTLMVVDRPQDRGLHPDGAPEPPPLARAEMAARTVTVWEVISDPAFWMIAMTVAIVTGGMKGMITNLAPLAIENGVTATQGRRADPGLHGLRIYREAQLCRARGQAWPARTDVCLAWRFRCGNGLADAGKRRVRSIVAGVGVIGLFGGLMVPIESYLAPRVFGVRAVGRAMGLLAGAILIALLLTLVLFGLIRDLTGSYRGIFWTFTGFAALALVVGPDDAAASRPEKDAGPAAVPAAVPAE